MKFNWGHGIAIFLGTFMLAVVIVVIKISTDPEYDHELITPKYYEEELKYQDEINSSNNSKNLSSKVKFEITDKGITLEFPKDFEYSAASGKIKIIRPSQQSLDFEMDLVLDQNYQALIPSGRLIRGRWNMKVFWEVGDQKYLFKKEFNY